MFVAPVTFEVVRGYLHGLQFGCRLAGIAYSEDDYTVAAESRGWDPRGNVGIVRDFKNKGLSDAEMVQELIGVELDAYRRAFEACHKSS
jgi:hypothetical protein